MKCPFELPVEKERMQKKGTNIDGKIKLYRIKPLLIPYTEEEADYIVNAVNCHEKLVKALKENYEYTKYAGANKRINTKEYMEEFFNKGLSAQKIAKEALTEAEEKE